jgi:hypothetical protein
VTVVGAGLAAAANEDAGLVIGGLLGAALGIILAYIAVSDFTAYDDASKSLKAYGAVLGFLFLGAAVFAYHQSRNQQGGGE